MPRMRQMLPCAARAARTPETSVLSFLSCSHHVHTTSSAGFLPFNVLSILLSLSLLLLPCIFFYSTVRSSCCACATKHLFLLLFLLYRNFPSHFYNFLLRSFDDFYPVLCLLSFILTISFYLTVTVPLFLCYTMVSSCRAYATMKHSFSIFFPITIRPCCNLSGRSIFLHRFRNTFCLFFFFLFIILLSFAN